jgi:hypothetical protein
MKKPACRRAVATDWKIETQPRLLDHRVMVMMAVGV